MSIVDIINNQGMEFDFCQVAEIILGYQNGLAIEQIETYADSDIHCLEMREIRLRLEKELKNFSIDRLENIIMKDIVDAVNSEIFKNCKTYGDVKKNLSQVMSWATLNKHKNVLDAISDIQRKMAHEQDSFYLVCQRENNN